MNVDVWNPDLCIYHGACDDGFGAAWAIWTRWPGCEFVPGFYGKDLPNCTGRNVLFVDFSAKRPVLDAIANVARSVVILDHHKTALADLEPLVVATSDGSLNGVAARIPAMLRDMAELQRPPVLAFFDMTRSGAVMAWEFAVGLERNDPPPTMLALIQDRDLWTFAFGDRTRRFSAALRTYPMDFAVWDKIAADPGALEAEGAPILRAHEAVLLKIVGEAYFDVIAGERVPVVNAPYHYASDAANKLLELFPSASFTASWFRRADGFVQGSLRSEDHRFDVSTVAKALGGGGHRNSAGFQSLAPSSLANALVR